MSEIPEFIKHCEESIIKGNMLTREEAFSLAEIPDRYLFNMLISAAVTRDHFQGTCIELCAIVNAKSGGCPEDCSYCAQSSRSKAAIARYPLLNHKDLIEKARAARNTGARRFSIVTSGRKVSSKDLKRICHVISEIRDIGILPCASLGLLDADEMSLLKHSGLDRYHHNLESSKHFFSTICSTHLYEEKTETIRAAQSAGLSVCSGGIFGMGETWYDRIEMAFSLKELNVDSIPINFLIPILGTPLEHREVLHPFEALRVIALYRLILPEKQIKICGGRLQVLDDFHALIFLAGADSIMTGDYLTTFGRQPDDDLRLINLWGLTLKGAL